MSADNATQNEILVSVVVPVYNVEPYLVRCLQSIAGQTYKNLQIILVDDGATDGSPKICDEFATLDARAEVIHKPNGGLSDARNAGIDISRGNYIVLVDSDDYLAPGYVETMLSAALKHGAKLVMCNFICVNDRGDEIDWQPGGGFHSLRGSVPSGDAMTALSDPVGGVYVVAWNKLYNRDLFSGLRYPIGKLHEDQFVIHHLLDKCDFIHCVPERLYYYVQREKSIISAGYTVRNLDVMDAFLDRARHYCGKKRYDHMSMAYRRFIGELAKSRCLIDFQIAENKRRWRSLRKSLDDDRSIIMKFADRSTKLRFLSVMALPGLYYKIIQRPWRKTK